MFTWAFAEIFPRGG